MGAYKLKTELQWPSEVGVRGSVVPSSSAMFGRSFPIGITAVVRTSNNHSHRHVSNNPVSFPLLLQSFHILTVSVRISALRVAIFSVAKFICHCKERQPVDCYHERSSRDRIVCYGSYLFVLRPWAFFKRLTLKIFYNFYRNWPFHIAQKIPHPSNQERISGLTVYLKRFHLLVPCDVEPYQVLLRNLGRILCLTFFFSKFLYPDYNLLAQAQKPFLVLRPNR
jgi:hypothetical protein